MKKIAAQLKNEKDALNDAIHDLDTKLQKSNADMSDLLSDKKELVKEVIEKELDKKILKRQIGAVE